MSSKSKTIPMKVTVCDFVTGSVLGLVLEDSSAELLFCSGGVEVLLCVFVGAEVCALSAGGVFVFGVFTVDGTTRLSVDDTFFVLEEDVSSSDWVSFSLALSVSVILLSCTLFSVVDCSLSDKIRCNSSRVTLRLESAFPSFKAISLSTMKVGNDD